MAKRKHVNDESEKKKKRRVHFYPSVKLTQSSSIADLIFIISEWMRLKSESQTSAYAAEINDYNIISKVLPELIELNNVIGMDDLKSQLVKQIVYFTQGLHTDEMMHTVISGDPGTGKTMIATLMAKIYSKLGFLTRNHITIASRDNFIGKYVGHTTAKSEAFLKNCIGGVLFIDEAYSLGASNTGDDTDLFSKEAINVLNRFLSENSSNFICIIAGYEKDLNKSFFSHNRGLSRRFPWKFTSSSYSAADLFRIFELQIAKIEWIKNYDSNAVEKIFETNKHLFTNNGGDCLILLDKCKMAHAIRVFGHDKSEKKKISFLDITEGFKLFKNHKRINTTDSNMSNIAISMYS